MNTKPPLPTVLCFSGHDPSGGAGIQADIEAIAANGARAITVITALTSQNTAGVQDFLAVDADWLIKQTMPLLEESTPDAIKIGMVASAENAKAILDICQQFPNIPVVLDPVLAAGTTGNLAHENLIDGLYDLAKQATLITPNRAEYDALQLSHHTGNILLTTTDSSETKAITHQWIADTVQQEAYTYDRLPHQYHGSGCTLASSIAALLAQKIPMAQAIPRALDYTWQTLHQAEDNGLTQRLPQRYNNG